MPKVLCERGVCLYCVDWTCTAQNVCLSCVPWEGMDCDTYVYSVKHYREVMKHARQEENDG